jgi:DNA polymerase elongation subunit (family B)
MLDMLNIEEVLFLDIETVPGVARYEDLSPQWKKLWDEKMRNMATETNPVSDLYVKAGIYAEFSRIIVISAGYLFRKEGEWHFRVKSFYSSDEKDLLLDFANALEKFEKAGRKKLCAHNGQEFDFPWISRRMLIHGLPLPRVLDIAGSKPWEVKDNLIDTLQLWKFGDYKHYTSLALLCAVFGIPTPKDDIDGSQVAHVYYVEKDIDRIVRYCEKDTLAVANLLLKYKGMPLVHPDHLEIV